MVNFGKGVVHLFYTKDIYDILFLIYDIDIFDISAYIIVSEVISWLVVTNATGKPDLT